MKINLTNFSLTSLGKVQPLATRASFGYVFWMLVFLLLGGRAFEVKAATDCNAVTEIPVAECQDLLILYNSTHGPNWVDKTDWNVTNTPCSWYGVECSGGHVLQLYLSDNQLSGPIPNFSNLPNLRYLYLSSNQLSGPIPNFSNLPKLTKLYLNNNQLSGPIPNFSNLPNLTALLLSSNQLSGPIPNFSNLPNLTVLFLARNQLSGPIPNFSNLPNLTGLHLHSNQLSGTIPNLNWSRLKELHLYSNCGLVAYDAAQETLLNRKASIWQTRSPSCPGVTTLTVTQTGNGVITSTSADINCGADCTENYASDTVVTLTATPDAGHIFKEWTGDCSGAATTTIKMDAAKNCTAIFSKNTPPNQLLEK